MTDTAEHCLNALVALSRNPELESIRNTLLDEVSNEDLKVVIKRLLEVETGYTISNTPIPIPESPSSLRKSATQSAPSPSSLLRNGRQNGSSDTESTFPQASFQVSR
jgi:hypothetical protein